MQIFLSSTAVKMHMFY